VVVDEDAADFLTRLEQQGPRRVSDLLRPLDQEDRSELLELLHDLAELGLLALA
jgi:hypothetical protein